MCLYAYLWTIRCFYIQFFPTWIINNKWPYFVILTERSKSTSQICVWRKYGPKSHLKKSQKWIHHTIGLKAQTSWFWDLYSIHVTIKTSSLTHILFYLKKNCPIFKNEKFLVIMTNLQHCNIYSIDKMGTNIYQILKVVMYLFLKKL